MASYKKYQTKKGTKWKFQLFLGRKNGKQIIKTRSGFDTKKEASTVATALEKQLRNESLLDNQYLTFEQVYHAWLENYKLTVKKSTWSVTTGIIKHHVLPIFGELLVTEINTTQCQNAVNKWFNQPLKNYQMIFNYLSRVLDYAVQMKYIVENPVRGVIIPNSRQQKEEDQRFTGKSNKVKSADNYYTKDELKTFLDCAKTLDNKQVYPLFWLLAFTGARSGEICALSWSDISFEHSSITSNKTRAWSSNGVITQTPKTEQGNRTIYIDPKTKSILEKWHVQQRKSMLILGYNTSSSEQLVFTNKFNNTLQNATLATFIKKIVKQTGLKRITPQGFRHTYATLAVQGELPPKELQTQLGHKDIRTTLNIYTAVTDQQLESIPDKFATFVDL